MMRRAFLLITLALSCHLLAACGNEDEIGATVASPAAMRSAATEGKSTGPSFTLTDSDTQPIFSRPGFYDYGASVIEAEGVRRYYWCANDLEGADVILYKWQDLATGTWSPTVPVLRPNNSLPTWDRSFICDPSVVRGQFFNPEDNQTYTFAMYYTATDRGPGGDPSLQAGTNGRVGVAYSNNGANWVKRSAPVIVPQSSPTNVYGAGQTAVLNYNGQAGLYMFHTDDSLGGERVFYRTTTDGIHFSPPTPLSTTGLLPTGATPGAAEIDVAYDPTNGYWYAVMALPYAAAETHRDGDGPRFQFGLYRMPAGNLSGGTWEHLGHIDTNLTGREVNHNAAFVRDSYGNVNVTLPNVEIIFSAGDGPQADAASWELYSARWNLNQPARIPLNRYYSPMAGSHLVTTGYVQNIFQFNQTLGYLYRARTPGTVPLYGCKIGSSNFVSLSSTCEGQNGKLGINGFIHSPQLQPPPQPYVALYRCFTGTHHFVSTGSNCEGQQVDYLLGYALLNPS